jgi:hypothetical protein
MRRCISGYVPADVTPVTGQKTNKMWHYFLPRPFGLSPSAQRVHHVSAAGGIKWTACGFDRRHIGITIGNNPVARPIQIPS